MNLNLEKGSNLHADTFLVLPDAVKMIVFDYIVFEDFAEEAMEIPKSEATIQTYCVRQIHNQHKTLNLVIDFLTKGSFYEEIKKLVDESYSKDLLEINNEITKIIEDKKQTKKDDGVIVKEVIKVSRDKLIEIESFIDRLIEIVQRLILEEENSIIEKARGISVEEEMAPEVINLLNYIFISAKAKNLEDTGIDSFNIELIKLAYNEAQKIKNSNLIIGIINSIRIFSFSEFKLIVNNFIKDANNEQRGELFESLISLMGIEKAVIHHIRACFSATKSEECVKETHEDFSKVLESILEYEVSVPSTITKAEILINLYNNGNDKYHKILYKLIDENDKFKWLNDISFHIKCDYEPKITNPEALANLNKINLLAVKK